MIQLLFAAVALIALGGSSCLAQGGQPQPSSTAADAQMMYEGWRARQALGSEVLNKQDRRSIGQVRDIVIDRDGRVEALIVEGGGPVQIPEAVYRIPWREVDTTPGEAGIVADLSDVNRPRYGLVPGVEGAPTLPREFRVTEVIGDHARLQTGHGFGYVTDVVFTKDGRVAGVLVTRDVEAAGRILAFPFPGIQTRWDPGASYFGLPQVTAEAAEQAAIPIEASRLPRTSL